MNSPAAIAAEQYDEDYYLRGVEAGVSNYQDYRWLPDTTISWAQHFKRYLKLEEGDSALEIGCARGYYCKALRQLGVEAFGYDVSEWAIQNCDPDARPFVSNYLEVTGRNYDVVWGKDFAEHVPPNELAALLKKALPATRKLFLIVPLAEFTGGPYVHPKEEKDVTHVNRWTLHDWIVFVQAQTRSFVVSGAYQYPGLKPGAYEVECGYGFILAERI